MLSRHFIFWFNVILRFPKYYKLENILISKTSEYHSNLKEWGQNVHCEEKGSE